MWVHLAAKVTVNKINTLFLLTMADLELNREGTFFTFPTSFDVVMQPLIVCIKFFFHFNPNNTSQYFQLWLLETVCIATYIKYMVSEGYSSSVHALISHLVLSITTSHHTGDWKISIHYIVHFKMVSWNWNLAQILYITFKVYDTNVFLFVW